MSSGSSVARSTALAAGVWSSDSAAGGLAGLRPEQIAPQPGANNSAAPPLGVTVYSQADAADIAATWVDLVDEVSTYGVLVLCNCCLMVGMVASMACVITGDEDDPSMIAGLLGVCTLCGTVVLAIPTFIYLIMIWLDDDDLEVPCGGNEDFESIDSVVVFACVVSPGCLAAPLSDQLQLLVLSLAYLAYLLRLYVAQDHYVHHLVLLQR